MKNLVIKAAPEVGTQATGVYVDGQMVGYITENYDFSGRASIAAYVGPGLHRSRRLGSFPDRDAAFASVKRSAGVKS